MTNGDRIRAMSDEELWRWLMLHHGCEECWVLHEGENCNGTDCHKKHKRWVAEDGGEK